MLQTRLGAVLFLIGSCFAQIELECPQDWVRYSRTCYKFVRSPVKNWINAQTMCQSYGADLIATGSSEENSFVKTWLQGNDPQRKEWYTSGADPQTSNTFIWLADKTLIRDEGNWIPNRNLYGQVVSYAYSPISNDWGWNQVDKDILRPYICEVPLEEVPTLKIIERGTDYGLIISDPTFTPRGPSFTIEPVDTVFDKSARTLTNDVTLKCVADGYPFPQYSWYRLEYQNEHLISKKVLVLNDNRYTQTDGILTINDPEQTKDRGQYYCVASNLFGSIRSVTVQITFGYVGEFQMNRDPVIAYLYSGIGIPCDPPTHFPNLIYFWTRSYPNFVDENQRVFVSYDGHLYISTVENTDAANYSCNIKSAISAFGKTGPIFPLVVEKEQSFGQLLIQTSFPKMFPEAPLAGQDVRIECVANGHPVPLYNWSRHDHKKLPLNSELSNYNRVLNIKNVQTEDSGDYVCTAYNSKGTVTAIVTLVVNAKPKFTIPLENLIVDIGSDIEWLCEAYGKPDVQYNWFKNNVEIYNLPNDERERIVLNGNTLSIKGVRDRDNGMYQCEARNFLSATYSSAELKVISMPPSFLKYPMEPLTYATDGQNVTLVCTPEAAPKPKIEWLKNNVLIPGGDRYKFLSNGNLEIQFVRPVDDGRYQCRATNTLGTAETSGFVITRRPPYFVARPENTHIIINNTGILSCEALADPALDLTYAWTFNEIKINFDIMGNKFQQGLIENPNINRGLLRVLNSSFADSGLYRCIAKTPISSIYAEAILTVVGPPGPISGITAKEVTKTNAVLRWNDGTNNGAAITSYVIEIRTKYKKEWSTLVANPPFKDDGPQKEIHLSNLSPFNNYEFRVLARNQFGLGEPSDPSGVYTTPYDKPYKFPANVGGGGGKKGDLTITWDPLPPEDQNAPGIKYVVFYRKEDGSDRNFEKKDILDSDRIFTVQVKEIYTPYLVKVMAVNNFGSGPESPPVIIFSAEDTPADAPQRVFATAYNSTAINVTWEPLINTPDRMRGVLRGHRIKFWRADQAEDDARYVLLNGTRNWGLVIGLRNFTQYWVKVFGFNTAGNGPESEPFQERTLKSAVDSPPLSVQIKKRDPTSITVTWRGVVPSEYEEPIDGYRIRYWRDDEQVEKATDVDFSLSYFKDKREMEAEVSGLIPGVLYNLRVLAYSRGGDGRMSNPASKFKTERISPYNKSNHPLPCMVCHLLSLLTLLYIFHPRH